MNDMIDDPQVGKMKPITREEWDRFDWIEITSVVEDSRHMALFIRGVEKVDPPDDVYVYIDKTSLGDGRQRWVRAMERVDE